MHKKSFGQKVLRNARAIKIRWLRADLKDLKNERTYNEIKFSQGKTSVDQVLNSNKKVRVAQKRLNNARKK